MKVITKKVVSFKCEKCHETFDLKKECESHERDCAHSLKGSLLGDWKKYIGRISSNRLLEIIYKKESTNERCEYWGRWFTPKSIDSSGVVLPGAKNSSADSTAHITTLLCDLNHLIQIYNDKATTCNEKLFIKHFAFDYIMDAWDYRHQRYHESFGFYLKFFYYPELNATNCGMGITQNLFQLYYVLQRMGISWEEITISVKEYVKTHQFFKETIKGIKYSLLESSAKELTDIKKIYKMPIFVKEKKLSFEIFSDALMDYVLSDFLKNNTNLNPNYSGIRELGNSYITIANHNTIEIENGKQKITLREGSTIIDKIQIPYSVTTWSRYQSKIHLNSSPISIPNTKQYNCVIKTNLNANRLKDGDLVIDVENDYGTFRSVGEPYKFNKKNYKKALNDSGIIPVKILKDFRNKRILSRK